MGRLSYFLLAFQVGSSRGRAVTQIAGRQRRYGACMPDSPVDAIAAVLFTVDAIEACDPMLGYDVERLVIGKAPTAVLGTLLTGHVNQILAATGTEDVSWLPRRRIYGLLCAIITGNATNDPSMADRDPLQDAQMILAWTAASELTPASA